MQNFFPICDNPDLISDLECIELRDSKLGLEIFCETAAYDLWVFRFCDHLTYRMMDEGDALEILSELGKGKKIGVYKVENSDFLQWFHRQSCGIRVDDDLTHYSIITLNDIIDVIAFSPPIWERT